jgi:proteasome lid subunit RPN8/RPN11
MMQGLVNTAHRLFHELSWSLQRGRTGAGQLSAPSTPGAYLPLERLLLTDEVSRTLFDEYASHREGHRGNEETGWVLLGLRDQREALVLATLPAGTQRDAGVAHVLFDSSGQAVASRIVRQADRRLVTLGVVHTHPGSLRHPSDGDFRADQMWIAQLRGKEGVFGIGTADSHPDNHMPDLGRHPRPHMQTLGKLCFSWYSLRQGEGAYRPLPVELVLGPDLARPLHDVWATIEAHAERLDRLARQQAGVSFELADGRSGCALAVTIRLAEPGTAIRVLLEGPEVQYLVERDGDLLAANPAEDRVDQGVYLLMAELAAHR